MAEQEDNTQENEAKGQQLAIQSIYIKDSSFEAPNSPMIFSGNAGQPQNELNISINSNNLGNDAYEVVLTVTVTSKFGEQTGFLVELHQAGIFTISGFQEEARSAVLGIYCANVLFSYAREAVSSMVSKGGFPQLLLTPVNFEALYNQNMQQKEAAQQQKENATH